MSEVCVNNPNIIVSGIDPNTVPKYSSVGCYPVFYLTADNSVLCPECVEENLEQCCDKDDPQWFVVDSDANWESQMCCDHCSEDIESAYGVPDEDD